MGFVPASSHAPSFPAGVEYFYDHKMMLRFRKPNSSLIAKGALVAMMHGLAMERAPSPRAGWRTSHHGVLP
jgi:hypothetical protein